jgi:hypothetical protein
MLRSSWYWKIIGYQSWLSDGVRPLDIGLWTLDSNLI